MCVMTNLSIPALCHAFISISLVFLHIPLSLSVRLSDADGAGGSVCRPRDATQTEGRVSAVAFAL